MHRRIQIDSWACLLGALLVLTVPLDWLISAFFAALFHELCHIGVINILGGRVCSVRIGTGGAVIEAEIPGKERECLCALAGPVGSLLLLSLCHVFPKLAICAGIQGCFNLLPVYPLDGGRALRCFLVLLYPARADSIMSGVEFAMYLVLLLLAVVGAYFLSAGFLPLLAVLFMIIRAVSRKRPCKRRRIGVQ